MVARRLDKPFRILLTRHALPKALQNQNLQDIVLRCRFSTKHSGSAAVMQARFYPRGAHHGIAAENRRLGVGRRAIHRRSTACSPTFPQQQGRRFAARSRALRNKDFAHRSAARIRSGPESLLSKNSPRRRIGTCGPAYPCCRPDKRPRNAHETALLERGGQPEQAVAGDGDDGVLGRCSDDREAGQPAECREERPASTEHEARQPDRFASATR